MVETSTTVDGTCSTIEIRWQPKRQSRQRKHPPISNFVINYVPEAGEVRVRSHYSYDNKDGSRFTNDAAAADLMHSCPPDVIAELGFQGMDGITAVFSSANGAQFHVEFFTALAEICDGEGYQQTWIPFTPSSYGTALAKANSRVARLAK